jgi:hypothetical protein
MLLLALFVACGDDAKTPAGGDDSGAPDSTPTTGDDSGRDPDTAVDTDTAPPLPDPALALSGTVAFDPQLGGAGAWTLTHERGDGLRVEVVGGDGAVVRTLADGTALVESVTWDGRLEDGSAAPAATYTVRATLLEAGEELLAGEAPVDVVRVGVTSGTFGGDRVALLWHFAGGPRMYADDGGDSANFVLASIDENGAPASVPAIWEDLREPPEDVTGQNLPAAYAYDARPTLTLTVDGTLGGAALTAAIPGWTLTSGSVAAGGTLVFTKDEALATGPGVVEEPLTLTWLSGEEVAGTQEIPVRIYALYDVPAFSSDASPNLPWLEVIDPALRDIEGVEPTREAVLNALVSHIYEDLGLSYDTRWGASAYVSYTGGGYNGARLDLTQFLDRRRGSTVNCTDCAALLEAFANMIGADLQYTIILSNYDLNYILAIGGDEFTHCPFGGTGCGFSYHAVTTDDDAATIWDATLALDGDEDPSTSPSTLMMVHAVGGDEYLDRLVMSGRTYYDYTQDGSIQ